MKAKPYQAEIHAPTDTNPDDLIPEGIKTSISVVDSFENNQIKPSMTQESHTGMVSM